MQKMLRFVATKAATVIVSRQNYVQEQLRCLAVLTDASRLTAILYEIIVNSKLKFRRLKSSEYQVAV